MSGYFSEIYYGGGATQDFIEIAVPTGTDVSSYQVQIYTLAGNVNLTYTSLGSVVQTTAGKDVYLIDKNSPGFNSLGDQSAIALYDGTSVLQFVSYQNNTVTAQQGFADGLTSIMIGSSPDGSSMETSGGGTSYYAQSSDNRGTIPCYAPGTLIDMAEGSRAVEDLRVGDLVMTRDHGPQPIRWVRSGDHALDAVEPGGKPVLIAAGALGPGLPAQDLIVSPQHRIMVGGGGQLEICFGAEAFASAKALTALPGIRHMSGKRRITWFHFACERREVVTANGCLSESLLLGPMVVNRLTRAQHQALTSVFGPPLALDVALNGPPALPCLTVSAVRRQIESEKTSRRHRLEAEIRKWDMDAAAKRHAAA